MTRFPAWVAMAAAMGFVMCTHPRARADVTLDISGTFGSYAWVDPQAPLNNGSFSGSVTLPSLPSNSQFAGDVTANVNFYNSANTFVFSVMNTASFPVYVTATANSSGDTQVTFAGYGSAGTATVDVASLILNFSNWSFGMATGTANLSSSIEYTYLPSATYFAPLMQGQATATTIGPAGDPVAAPEPSTFPVCLISMLGGIIYARCRCHPSTV